MRAPKIAAKLITLLLLLVASLSAQVKSSLIVSRFSHIISSATVIDNRPAGGSTQNFMHTFCATGTGVWSVTIQYSNTSSAGPWTDFLGSSATVASTSQLCLGGGYGLVSWIRFSIAGTVTIDYTGQGGMYMTLGTGGGGGGGGTVTGVGLAFVPTWFTVAGSPITTSGTFAVSMTPGQAANQVIASPNGATGAFGPRLLVGADIPVINLASSARGGVSGNLPVTNLNGGLNADASHVWCGNATWCTVGAGTVGSVAFPTTPSWLTAVVSNPTTAPSIALTPATGQPANQILATSGGIVVVRAMLATDVPLLTGTQMPAFTGDMTKPSGSTVTTVVGINGTLLSGLATGILKNTTATGVPSIAVAGTDYQAPLGFTPENVANKNATNGYAGLSSGLLSAAQLPTPGASSLGGVQSKDCGSAFIQKINTDGTETCATPPGTGTVTSIDATLGVETTTGSPITVTGTLRANETVNNQTGTSYTVLVGDRSKLITLSNSGTIAVTVPQCGVTFPGSWFADIQDRGAGSAIVTPLVSTIDGQASLTVGTSQGFRLVCDGSSGNYFTQRGIGGAGSGTVTHTAGVLGSTAIVTGNGGGDIQTPNAASTLDSSGNLSVAGTMSTGDGTAHGKISMCELLINGAGCVGFEALDALTNPLSLVFPDAQPIAGDMMLFGATVANQSAFTFVQAVTGGPFTTDKIVTGGATGQAIKDSSKGFSGTGSNVATTTGTLTNGNCVQIDASGNFIQTGGACASPTIAIANEGATGTTVSKLVSLTGAPSKAIVSPTTDTTQAVGICTANCSTTGNATIQFIGSASCVFDGATTAGHYVSMSTGTAGDCHDESAIIPTAKRIVGRVLSTNGGAGTYTIDLFPPSSINTQATLSVALFQGSGVAFDTAANLCLAALPAAGGVCDARNITGSQTGTTALALGKYQSLLLGAMTYTSSANPVASGNQSAQLIGLGSGGNESQASDTSATRIVVSTSGADGFSAFCVPSGGATQNCSQGAGANHKPDAILVKGISFQASNVDTGFGTNINGINSSIFEDVTYYSFHEGIGNRLTCNAVACNYNSYRQVHITPGSTGDGFFFRLSANAQRISDSQVNSGTNGLLVGDTGDDITKIANEISCKNCSMESQTGTAFNVQQGLAVTVDTPRCEIAGVACFQTAANILAAMAVVGGGYANPGATVPVYIRGDGSTLSSTAYGFNMYQEDVGGISTRPHRNLAPNAGMEAWCSTTNLCGWSNLITTNWDNATPEHTQNTTKAVGGTYALQCGDGTNASRGCSTGVALSGVAGSGQIKVVPGVKYSVRFYWTTTGTSSKARWGFRLYDSTNTIITTGSPIYGQGTITDPPAVLSQSNLAYNGSFQAFINGGDQTPTVIGTMQTWFATYIFPPNTDSVRFGIWPSTASSYAYIDEFAFTQGPLATNTPTFVAGVPDGSAGGVDEVWSTKRLNNPYGIQVRPAQGTNVPVCHLYTLNNNGTNWTVATDGAAAVAGAAISAALTQSVTLFALPARGKVTGVTIKTATAWSGTGFTTFVTTLGGSVGGAGYYVSTDYDLTATAGNTNFLDAAMFQSGSFAGSNITADLTANQLLNANAITGATDYSVCWVGLP